MNPPANLANLDNAATSLAHRGYGARLRAAREQTGLTVDQVAQQLKLAPRQVQAIEDEDLAVLPEVTYIRGFVRNYARLLRIDAADLLDGLPVNGAEPAQGATFRRARTRMTELPPDSGARASWARWGVPLLLALAALAFAGYEWFRQDRAPAVPPSAADTPSTASPAIAPAAGGTPESQALSVNPSVLPEGNPGGPGAGTTGSGFPGAGGGDPGSPPPASPAEARPSGSAMPSTGGAATAPAPAPSAIAAQMPTSPSATSGPEAAHSRSGEVRLAFIETAWVEVRDGRGRVLHSQTNPPGSTRVVTGDPPFALVVGNARKVRVSFNGQPVDLAQHTHSNIARLTLR